MLGFNCDRLHSTEDVSVRCCPNTLISDFASLASIPKPLEF
jgi:hypothetical protein